MDFPNCDFVNKSNMIHTLVFSTKLIFAHQGFVALCRRAHAVTPSQQTPHIFEILGLYHDSSNDDDVPWWWWFDDDGDDDFIMIWWCWWWWFDDEVMMIWRCWWFNDDDDTRYPSTYTPSSTGSCAFTISKISSDICQVLLSYLPGVFIIFTRCFYHIYQVCFIKPFLARISFKIPKKNWWQILTSFAWTFKRCQAL